jgi:hypothetical protein
MFPGYFFTYDSLPAIGFASGECRAGSGEAGGPESLCLSSRRKKPVAHFFDLVGNFWIDREKNERILKDVVKIRDKL